MPLREFTDRRGDEWKVWDITPDRLHPSTRVGDYLQGFVDGWLVFESMDGRDKRRLYPVPVDWQELSDDALDELCARAESVRGGRPSSGARASHDGGARDVSDARASAARTADGRTADGRAADGRAADGRAADGRAADGRAADGPGEPRAETIRPPAPPGERPAARTFLYPGGRVWTVAEQYIQLRDRMGEPLDARTVLRFTSGMRSLDLLAWPPEWATYSEEELAELLGRAFPRDRASSDGGPYRRRRSDQRA